MFEVLAVLFVILQVGVLASLAVMAFSVNNRLEDICSQMRYGHDLVLESAAEFLRDDEHMPDPKEG